MGLPLLEPELHPSYVLRSVVLTSPTSNQYAASEVCTRKALGEAVGTPPNHSTLSELLTTPLTRGESEACPTLILFLPRISHTNRLAFLSTRVARMLDRKGSIETLVVSIAGTPPSEKDWDQLFTRMAGTCVFPPYPAATIMITLKRFSEEFCKF